MTDLAMKMDADVPTARLLINGEWRGGKTFDVTSPYLNQVVTRGVEATSRDVADAVAAAASNKDKAARVPHYERAEWLRKLSHQIGERSEEIAYTMALETGKPLKDGRVEARRAKETVWFCAEEAVRIDGQHVPVDGSELGTGRLALLLRFPVGVVGAVTPFNAPFNLICHKVGPAIAAGNTIVLKGPPEAPMTAALFAEMAVAAGIPAGFVNIVHGHGPVGEAIVKDPRVDFITFTGSTRAGLAIKQAAGMRRATLELGGLGPNIVHEDADLAKAAPMCGQNGVRISGQSCVSVQNLFVHRKILDPFLEKMVGVLSKMKLGDPLAPETDIGPMIKEEAAKRVESWIQEALAQGARALCGGKRQGAFVEPTVLVDVKEDMKVVCQEIFGPVISVRPYDDLDTVIKWINGTGFGLNCGVFTGSLATAFKCFREIQCGGIIVNGTSTYRPDQTPYGGVKNSGNGREGPNRAIREMMDERLVLFNV